MPDLGHSRQTTTSPEHLLREAQQLIEGARRAGDTAGAGDEVALLNWRVGQLIRKAIGVRAPQGAKVIKNLSAALTETCGRGWGEKHIRHCLRAAATYPDEDAFRELCRAVTWTHVKTLIYLSDSRRAYYTEMCRQNGWYTRQLQDHIQASRYERTALMPASEAGAVRVSELADSTMLGTESPFSFDLQPDASNALGVLDFRDWYAEKDYKNAILHELELFLLSCGAGFGLVARQKHFQADGDDACVDFIFYSRKDRRLVVVDLEVGEFQGAYEGRMALSLRWLAYNDQERDEEPPLGVIIRIGNSRAQVELLGLDRRADHAPIVPSRDVWVIGLQQSVRRAQQWLSRRSGLSIPSDPS